jgi:ATP-dependent Clp protease ATP-binding subunit ClpA
MFERYTERARRVLFFARYECSQLGSVSIETEHLLLGLIREGKGLTARIFARSHVSFETIRREVEGRTMFREKISVSVEIPFSPETKRVLGFAAEEADRLLHNYIGTEHLLLGILREERSVAASILKEKGMRLGPVRDDIVTLLNEKTPATTHEEGGVEGETHYFTHVPKGAGSVPELPLYVPSRTVHITYSNLSPAIDAWIQHAGPVWRALGYSLSQIVAHAWNAGIDSVRLVNPRRRDQQARYDFTIVRPQEVNDDEITALLREAVQTQLEVQVTSEGDGVSVTPVIS